MHLIDKYLPYSSIIVASALFLLLGLWWRLSAAKAMELAPKSAGWVKNYRAGGFPLRRVLPEHPKLRFWAFLLVLLLAAAFTVGHLANLGMIYLRRPTIFFSFRRYSVLLGLLYTLGAAAVYLLLNVLFDSCWVSFPGTLLFLASAARGHGDGCVLALSLLFLVLYLRAEKPGFPSELLYLCAVLCLSPMLALRPALIWLCLCFPLAHWYKLRFQRRERKLSGGSLLLALLAALLAWGLTVVLAAVLQRFMWSAYRLSSVLALTDPAKLLQTLKTYVLALPNALFHCPHLGMTVDLMVDAPLFGFGLWGVCAAWRLAKQRRDARGVFVLLVMAALLIVWLLTDRYVLTLGLTLTTACVLREADLGKKRWPVVLLTLAGVLWYIGIQIAGWYVPLTEGLVERLV